MKTKITILLIFLLTTNTFSKSKFKINYKNDWLVSTPIIASLEINGHTFYNDTYINKIIYRANLQEVQIIDTITNTTYKVRDCGDKNCKIVHLVELPKINILYCDSARIIDRYLFEGDTISYLIHNNRIIIY